ncbi:MAG: SUMF1/EgtB/PvdO family nonheme iron enzyme [Deltaproteobacteria bacterium]|nr:SUMF1/EgtB/PvdO family nonheme iron enzyme [Deltaproteobacteria bacterium]
MTGNPPPPRRIARSLLVLLGLPLLVTTACEDARVASPCGRGEEVAEPAPGYCVYRGRDVVEPFACPGERPYRVDLPRGVVCAAEPVAAASLPPAVCYRLGEACPAADAATDPPDGGGPDASMPEDAGRLDAETRDAALDAEARDATLDARATDAALDAEPEDAALDAGARDAALDADPRDAMPDAAPDSGADAADAAGDARIDGDASGDAATDGGLPAQRSCPDPLERGCGVVPVAGATFTLGEAGAVGVDTTITVTVSPFAIDTHEVTVVRFRRFYEAGMPAPDGGAVAYPGGRTLPAPGTPVEPIARAFPSSACNWTTTTGETDHHPLNCVGYRTALAFCAWDGGRLPTEAEWELVARHRPVAGTTAPRRFPWGEERPMPSCDRAHWFLCAGSLSFGPTREVGSFASTGGVYDLAGSVWEWTADRAYDYGDVRCPRVDAVDPLCPSGVGSAMFRGGAWRSESDTDLWGSARRGNTLETGILELGFRCAR